MNIYDISEKAGVSIATVSRVLNGSSLVSEKTREKVLAVMRESGYVPNPFARGLGLNTMRTIGLLCPDAADSYLAQAIAYIERALREHGYDCLLYCTGRKLDMRKQGMQMLVSKHVDGVVLLGSTFVEDVERDNDYIRQASRQVPLVMLNGSYACDNVYCVVCDDYRAAMESTQYLLDTGRKRILYLYHNKNFSGQQKLRGYKAGLAARDVPVDEALIHFCSEDKRSIPTVRDDILAMAQRGLMFDAILTSEDLLAVGAAKYARIAKRSVPKDLSIIGYNNSTYCLCCEPELTSMDNKLEAICNQCVATVLGALAGRQMPQKTVYTAELIKRGSTL